MRRVVFSIAALLFVAGCGSSGGAGNVMNQGPRTVIVQVVDDAYSPQSVQINQGDTVRWVLAGSHVGHTVTALNGSFDSGFVFNVAGDTFERTFTINNTTFEYSCQTHKACCAMQGSVLVGSMAPRPMPGY